MKHTIVYLISLLMSLPLVAQNVQKGDYYLYCHMAGNGEWTSYAISEDGLHYKDLLGGNPVYNTAELSPIEGGARDAYICRRSDSANGYLMVTTDMSNRTSHTWFNHGIDLLKSDDLINWTSVAFDFNKGSEIFCDPESPDVYKDWTGVKRVWAPQIFWDPSYEWKDGTKGGYLIYYSLWNPDEEEYDRMYYSYADHSFTKLTKPRLLFDWGYATIDADINYLESDGLYHMLIKKEGGHPGIFHATAKNLLGPWSQPDENDYVSFEGNKKCEGSSAFQIEGEKGWRVAYIEYSSRPKHYRICKADEHLSNFSSPRDIEGVANPQHGSFMRITKSEYNRLARWGLKKTKVVSQNIRTSLY